MLGLWNAHRGKMAGLIVGLLFGLLVMTLGFWRSLFISLCMAVGYFIGKRIDEKGSLNDLFSRITSAFKK